MSLLLRNLFTAAGAQDPVLLPGYVAAYRDGYQYSMQGGKNPTGMGPGSMAMSQVVNQGFVGPAFANTMYGRALATTIAGTFAQLPPSLGWSNVFTTRASTVHVLVYCNGAIGSLAGLLSHAATSNGGWEIYVSSTGVVTVSLTQTTASTLVTAAGVLVANKWHLVSVTYSGDNTQANALKLYVNGVAIAGTYTVGTARTADDTALSDGRVGSSADVGIAANFFIPMAAVASYIQPQSEIVALVQNPFRMFPGSQRRLPFPNTFGVITFPASDVSQTGWTASPGPTFAAEVGGWTFNDSNTITSPVVGTGAPLIMTLSSPLAAGSWDVQVRGEYVGSFACAFVVKLLDASNTVVGTSAPTTLGTSLATILASITTTATAYRISIEVQ